MEDKYTSIIIVDGKPRKVIIDENGKIVNRTPNKEEMKGLKNYTEENNKKSRILVSFDEQNFFWTVYDGDSKKLIMNPTKEDLKGLKLKRYNSTNICPICREEKERDGKELTDKSILYPGNASHNMDDKGNNTDKWVCGKHRRRYYQRYNSNSQFNIIKSMRDRRTGNLKDECNMLGDNCEILTSKLFRVKRLNIEYDKYNMPLDHSPIPEGIFIMIGERLTNLSGKVPQTQGRHFTTSIGAKGGWPFRNFAGEKNKKYDIFMLWCISEDGLNVDRGYILPKEKLIERTGISIIKEPIGGWHISPWYEDYLITDEKIIKKANEIWKQILN